MTTSNKWERTPLLLRMIGKPSMRRRQYAQRHIVGNFYMNLSRGFEYRGDPGRSLPRNPPARKYSFGVAWEFVDFMEDRDEVQRQYVRDFATLKRLYRAYRREEVELNQIYQH